MKKEDIDRINELARKAKTVGLTPEENEERAVLRRAYIDSVVGDLRQQLDHLYRRQQGQQAQAAPVISGTGNIISRTAPEAAAGP